MSPVNLHAHFEMSGNCCTNCCRSGLSEDQKLYVNKRYELEKWDKKKANAESIQKTASRLDSMIREKIPGSDVDKEVTYELINSKLKLEIEKRPITKRDLVAIIQAIQEVHNDS